jgi:hypothetical protein
MTQQTSQNMPPPQAQVAKHEAADVGRTAADAGRDVAGTAAEQAGQVADEAKRQARDLLGEVRSQATQQARTGQQNAADGIRSLAGELREMADGGERRGTASELAAQAADRLHGVADWIGAREPGDLVNEVRRLARRRPGAFLLGAAVAGVLAGRLTRGTVDAKRDTGSDAASYPGSRTTDPSTAPIPAAPPLPVQPAGPPHPYDLPPEAGRSPGPPVGSAPPAPGLPNGGPYTTGSVPPAAVPPVPRPQHVSPTPPPNVGEYVEQQERGNGPQHGGAR